MSLLSKVAEISDKINKFKTEKYDPKIKWFQERIEEKVAWAQSCIDKGVNGWEKTQKVPVKNEDGTVAKDEDGNVIYVEEVVKDANGNPVRVKGSKKFVYDNVEKAQAEVDKIQAAAEAWVKQQTAVLQKWVDDNVEKLNEYTKKEAVMKLIEKAKASEGLGKTPKELLEVGLKYSEEDIQKLMDKMPNSIPQIKIPEYSFPKANIDLVAMIPDVWSALPKLQDVVNTKYLYSLIPDLPSDLGSKFNLPQLSELQQMIESAEAAGNLNIVRDAVTTAAGGKLSLPDSLKNLDVDALDPLKNYKPDYGKGMVIPELPKFEGVIP